MPATGASPAPARALSRSGEPGISRGVWREHHQSTYANCARCRPSVRRTGFALGPSIVLSVLGERQRPRRYETLRVRPMTVQRGAGGAIPPRVGASPLEPRRAWSVLPCPLPHLPSRISVRDADEATRAGSRLCDCADESRGRSGAVRLPTYRVPCQARPRQGLASEPPAHVAAWGPDALLRARGRLVCQGGPPLGGQMSTKAASEDAALRMPQPLSPWWPLEACTRPRRWSPMTHRGRRNVKARTSGWTALALVPV